MMAVQSQDRTSRVVVSRRLSAQRSGRRFGSIGIRLAVVAFGGILWEIYARLADSIFIPPLSSVLARMWQEWVGGNWRTLFLSPEFIDMVFASAARLLPGLAIGVFVGITLGVALARVRLLGEVFSPFLQFLRAIPSSAKIPMFMAVLGVGDTMKIWLIGVTVSLHLLMNVMDGVRNVNPTLLAMAKVYQVSRWDRLWGILLPASAPQIFAGLRIATMTALIIMVLSELTGGSDGVGYYVLYAQRQFEVVDMWAGVILLGIIGYLLNAAVSLAERRALRWQ